MTGWPGNVPWHPERVLTHIELGYGAHAGLVLKHYGR